MIWESNDEVGKVKEKYSLTVLHVACTPKEANNKKQQAQSKKAKPESIKQNNAKAKSKTQRKSVKTDMAADNSALILRACAHARTNETKRFPG